MDLEKVGLGMKAVREAHRYCNSDIPHGGHDLKDCLMWKQLLVLIERQDYRDNQDFLLKAGK